MKIIASNYYIHNSSKSKFTFFRIEEQQQKKKKNIKFELFVTISHKIKSLEF